MQIPEPGSMLQSGDYLPDCNMVPGSSARNIPPSAPASHQPHPRRTRAPWRPKARTRRTRAPRSSHP